MQYRDDAQLDQGQVSYSKGSRTGRIALGGGAGIVVLVLALVFGFDLTSFLDPDPAPEATGTQDASAPACELGSDIDGNRECRWVAYVNSIQGYWKDAYPGYVAATTEIFSGSVDTACGTANSQVGPFYCPEDRRVYIDTAYAGLLLDKLGATGGDAAEAYILAHEYGHHISNLSGQLARARAGGNTTGPKSAQTRLELQADCYAGVWFANTVADEDSIIEEITADDLERVVDAAKAVGDDNIQLQSTGGVTPESWTHGSSAMRQRWVNIGFASGDPASCDTFATDDLGG